ncbi:MAG: (Fe-S)-binding protein [Methanobacteriaceae archaeon]|nr:(Fe-S)-binding protein [Methanobacteriaceae archaeon]
MIYFQGCTARDKLQNISRNTRKILDAAGIKYKILDNEGCCGSILLRTGFQEDAIEVMEKTFEQLKGEKVLLSCAGCYRTLSEDYPKLFGENLDVIHISQLLKELINDGKISLKKDQLKATYHDPCHLGRHSGEYDAPREVLRAKAELLEMDKIRENANCCGAGGGVKSAYPELSSEIGISRVDDALETGADILVTCCPFCVLNLESEKLSVMDLTEFVSLDDALSKGILPPKKDIKKNIIKSKDGSSPMSVTTKKDTLSNQDVQPQRKVSHE